MATSSKASPPRRLWRKLRPKRYEKAEQQLILEKEAMARFEDEKQEQESKKEDPTMMVSYWPVFDFEEGSTLDEFERIDDVIMGGVSSSQLRQQKCNETTTAIWSGVCRAEGGGFCGFRTRAWSQPLSIPQHIQGFYLDCKFTSDSEPERRVWKMVTRAEQSRGEFAYQAAFTIPPKQEEWTRIQVPFSDFRQVRGARAVEGGVPLDAPATGLYQIGLIMSRFQFAQNMTQLENFRPGYFELCLKNIGFYSVTSSPIEMEPIWKIQKLTTEEVSSQRPLVAKALFPLLKLFFSEQSQRRKVAMKKLQERKMSRWEAIRFAFQWRCKSVGFARAMRYMISVIAVDSVRTTTLFMLKWLLVKPIGLIVRSFKRLSTMRAPGL